MVKKIFTRLIWTLAGLLLGSIIIFLFSQYVPFDSIENKLVMQGLSPESSTAFDAEYNKLYIKENKHLPLFYFSILPNNYHHNYRSITNRKLRTEVREKQKEGYKIRNMPDGIEIDEKKSEFHYPVCYWFGAKNQFQVFMTNLFNRDLGTSRKDGKAVVEKISAALNWTLISIIFSLFLSIPIAFILSVAIVKSVSKKLDKTFLILAAIVFSIPSFVLATFVLIFLTTDQYGIQVFSSPLYIPIQNNSMGEILRYGLPKLAPSIFCAVITDLFYLTYLLRNNMLGEIKKTYVVAAKARGNNDNQIVYQQVLPNVMIPFATLLINSIPVALAGSVVYELIFNIPGMGKLLYDGIYNADWNVVYGIVLLVMIVTSFVYIAGDLLYKWLDPRLT